MQRGCLHHMKGACKGKQFKNSSPSPLLTVCQIEKKGCITAQETGYITDRETNTQRENNKLTINEGQRQKERETDKQPSEKKRERAKTGKVKHKKRKRKEGWSNESERKCI